ncbi:MAG: DUF3373 domain-containing protein, partial [Deltaproteobacteria bacterium]|nr:DUF3373 domain-containing protein [Deltaproteobacteria bacterium]
MSKITTKILVCLGACTLLAAPAGTASAQDDDQLDESVGSEGDAVDDGSDTSSEVDGTEAGVAPAPAPQPPEVQDLADRLTEAEERLDQVQNKTDVQKLSFSGDYRTILAGFRYEGPDPTGARDAMGQPIQVEDTNGEQWLHRFRMDIRARPLPNVRFTGRLTMYKRYGTNTATLFPQDQAEAQIPRDTAMRLERAWLDWFITPKIALSLGRISYTNGPPGELKENLDEPDATWGLQMVDGEFDTVDLTFKPHEMFLARLFYASWAFPRNDDLFSEFLPLNNGVSNLRIIGGNIDLKAPKLGKHLIQLGFYTVPKFRPFVIPISNPVPTPNPSNSPPPFDGSLVFPSILPDSLGSYHNLSGLVLLKNIADSGLDMFAALAVGILRPNDESISYSLPFGPMGEQVDVPFLALASAE